MAKGQLHLAPNGPELCKADPSKAGARGCPFEASGHFETMAEAEKAFSEAMGGGFSQSLKKAKSESLAPETPEEIALADEYNEYIFEEEIEIADHSGLADDDYVTLEDLRENPELLANNCYVVSSELAQQLSGGENEVGVISIAYRDDHSHHAVSSIDDYGRETILDFTAAQYDSNLPIPYIASREKWQATIGDRVAKAHGTTIAQVYLESEGASIAGSKIPERFYHFSPKANLSSIAEQGILPSIGERSFELGENEKKIYLFESKMAAEDALGSWLGDEYEDVELALFSVDSSKVQAAKPTFDDPEGSWEWSTNHKIAWLDLAEEPGEY